jgi:hypothetical protein
MGLLFNFWKLNELFLGKFFFIVNIIPINHFLFRYSAINGLIVNIRIRENGEGKVKKAPCKFSFTRRQVPRTGFEPAHPCERCDLNTVRLPISPSGHPIKGLQK